jgi:hypothetical protein
MSITTTNMGLVAWNASNDYFNHTELANNFVAIDEHDHSSGKGLPVARVAANAVDANAIANGAVTNAKLASPLSGSYGVLFESFQHVNGLNVGTYLMRNIAGNPTGSGVDIGSTQFPYFYFDPADYAVAGLTTKLRVRAQAAVNNVAAGVNFTVGLYPFTIAGASLNIEPSVGSVVAGSTAALTTPAASTVTQNNSGDFTVPSAGPFLFAWSQSGSAAAGSLIKIAAQLQVRHV